MSDVSAANSSTRVASLVPLSADAEAALRESPFGPFELHAGASAAEVEALLHDGHADALLIMADGTDELQALAAHAAAETALLVVVDTLDAVGVRHWQQRGAQDVLLRSELASATLAVGVSAR